MSSADLNSELRKRAEETAESILRAAQADADRIAADAERLVEDRQEALLTSKENEYQSESRSVIASERQEAMRLVLLARTQLVERVLDEARSLLPEAVRTEAYRSRLAAELANALAFVDAGGVVVRCSEVLEPAVRDALETKPDARVEASSELGSGFSMAGREGTVQIDGTLETRLERLTPQLAIEIHERLRER